MSNELMLGIESQCSLAVGKREGEGMDTRWCSLSHRHTDAQSSAAIAGNHDFRARLIAHYSGRAIKARARNRRRHRSPGHWCPAHAKGMGALGKIDRHDRRRGVCQFVRRIARLGHGHHARADFCKAEHVGADLDRAVSGARGRGVTHRARA